MLRQAYQKQKHDRKLELRLWETQGLLLCLTGSADAGVKLLERAVKKTKDDYSHHAWGNGAYYMEAWGTGALLGGKLDVAEEAFLEALAHDTGSVRAAMGLQVLCERQGRLGEARRYAALAGKPDGPLELARFLARRRRPEEALRLCESVRDSAPPERFGYACLAVLRAARAGDDACQRVEGWLAEAIDTARKEGQSEIIASGHTDRAGSPAYNVKLSKRRADVVKEVMVQMGANTDEWVAGIASYIRNNFGNAAGMVTAADVARVRADTLKRKTQWTVPEIEAALPRVMSSDTWKLSASHNTESAALATSLRGWNTGGPQATGMWFQIELAQPAMVSEIIFDSPGGGGRGGGGGGGFGRMSDEDRAALDKVNAEYAAKLNDVNFSVLDQEYARHRAGLGLELALFGVAGLLLLGAVAAGITYLIGLSVGGMAAA